MGISVKNRKILWTRAGNQCAFPGCRQRLVEKVQDVGPDIVVGEEAHIVSRSRKGPRGCESIPQEGVDSYTNIILLCPTHHNIVDSAPDFYTKQYMIDIKSAHEHRVRFNQPSDGYLLEVAATVPNAIGKAVNCWQIGGSIVVIYSYGSPPVRLDHDHWRAAGVRIGQLHATEDVHWLFDSSDAEPDIEYWPSDSKFYVIQETFLYDEKRLAPFVKHEFDLTKVPALSQVELLLDADPSLVEKIPDIVKEIGAIDRGDYSDRLDVLLFQMWRAGLSDPIRVCEEFRRFKGASWCSGAISEGVTSMSKELALVQRAKASI